MRHIARGLVLLLLAGALVALSQATVGPPSATAQQPTVAAYLPNVRREPNTPTATIMPSATPLPTTTPTEIAGLPKFKNPGFEQGHTGWVEIPGNAIIQQFSSVTPHAGQWLADLGGEQDSRDELQQVIALPNVQPLYLSYFVQYVASGSIYDDEFLIDVNTTNVSTVQLFLNGPDTHKWEHWSADLSAYAGQTVTLRLRIYFGGAGIHTYLDDISLSSNP